MIVRLFCVALLAVSFTAAGSMLFATEASAQDAAELAKLREQKPDANKVYDDTVEFMKTVRVEVARTMKGQDHFKTAALHLKAVQVARSKGDPRRMIYLSLQARDFARKAMVSAGGRVPTEFATDPAVLQVHALETGSDAFLKTANTKFTAKFAEKTITEEVDFEVFLKEI